MKSAKKYEYHDHQDHDHLRHLCQGGEQQDHGDLVQQHIGEVCTGHCWHSSPPGLIIYLSSYHHCSMKGRRKGNIDTFRYDDDYGNDNDLKISPTSVLPSVYVLNPSTLSATLIQPNNFTNEKIARRSENVINKGIGQIRHDHFN